VYLADFGIAGAFFGLTLHTYLIGSVRYMAPEAFAGASHWAEIAHVPSKESDVYSLAVTAYEVCPYVVNHPTI
jgi:serine/threonine protein kinase